jgi:hypothetical protein
LFSNINELFILQEFSAQCGSFSRREMDGSISPEGIPDGEYTEIMFSSSFTHFQAAL